MFRCGDSVRKYNSHKTNHRFMSSTGTKSFGNFISLACQNYFSGINVSLKCFCKTTHFSLCVVT